MELLIKGNILEQFIGAPCCSKFNIDGSNGCLLYIVDEDNLKKYKLKGHYDFSLVKFQKVVFLCSKIGKNEWASAPFSPHLADNFVPTLFSDKKGMALTILLISNTTGEIVDMDFLILGNEFSNALEKISLGLLNEDFNIRFYQEIIQTVYNEFQTDEELANISNIKYSID